MCRWGIQQRVRQKVAADQRLLGSPVETFDPMLHALCIAPGPDLVLEYQPHRHAPAQVLGATPAIAVLG